MHSLIGSSLGPYQILDQIGMGGMATVYRAYQPSMDRYVAIKVLPQQMAQEDETFLKRFEQEARTIARLEHRNILPVHDYGETDGYTYLVMRYVDAGTLKHLIVDGPINTARAIRLIRQVAEALEYAHQNGVIHRDVKPSNVLVDDQDHVYLTDFGIAKLLSSSAKFTSSDMMIGTPAYMSPEQAQGAQADGRSDIYSLGVMLFEMVTGQAPYEAETPMAVMLKHIQAPLPPPRTIRADLPSSVERIILRAMAKLPDERFQTCAEMIAELDRALTDSPTAPSSTAQVMPSEPTVIVERELEAARSIPGRAILVAVLAVFGMVIVALVVLSGRGAPGESTPFPDAGATGAVPTEPAAEAVTTSPPEATAVAAVPVTEPGGWSYAVSSAFTSDLVLVGDTVYAATGGGLVRWTMDGQATHFTPANGLPLLRINALAVAPDGALWLGGNQTGIVRVTIAGDAIGEAAIYTPEDGLSSNLISALYADGETLWAGNAYGQLVDYFDGEGWRGGLPVPLDDSMRAELGDFTTRITRTSDDVVWVGTERGLLRLPSGAANWEVFPGDGPIRLIYEDRVSQLFVSEGGRLWSIQLDAFPDGERQPLEQFNDNCAALGMLQASDATYWIVCEEGVAHIDREGRRRTFFATQDGLPGRPTGALLEDPQGRIWVATDNGIAVTNGQRWTTLGAVEGAPTGWLAFLQQTGDGQLWAANQDWDGLAWRYDPAGETWQTFDFRELMWGGITGFVVDTRGASPVLWVTSWEGSFGQYRTVDGRARTYGPDQGFVSNYPPLSLEMDAAGTLWIGMVDGVYRFEPEGERFTFYGTAADSEPLGRITHLYAAPDGTLWAGHRGLEPNDAASINDQIAGHTLDAIDREVDTLRNMPAAGDQIGRRLENLSALVDETYARMEAVWNDDEAPRREAATQLEGQMGRLMDAIQELTAFVEAEDSGASNEVRRQARAILDVAQPLPGHVVAFIEARLSPWAPTPNYVYRYDPESDSFARLDGAGSPSRTDAPYLSDMAAFGEHGLLVSVAYDALYEWDGERWSRLENPLEGQQLGAVAVGPEGRPWVIAPESGLVTQDDFGWFGIPWQEGPGTTALYDLLFASDGTLWIGAENGLIHRRGQP